ncbi:MAG: hypothetical protein V3R99_10895 [Thermoguttaceae bacterium]
MPRTSCDEHGPLFPPRRILTIATIAMLVALAALGMARAVHLVAESWGWQVDCPRNWPLSMFSLKIPGIHEPVAQAGIAVGIAAVFFLLVRRQLHRITEHRSLLLAAGGLLVLSTNLIHGPTYGLVQPHRDAQQYYHDAVQVSSASRFLEEFNTRQPQLGCHARTHPPGAVLLLHGLRLSLGSPAAISVAMALAAVGLTGFFFYGVLAYDFDRQTCGYVTLLLLLIPSIQIYYCATLDAIVAGCFLGLLYFIRHPHWAISVAGSLASLLCASMLTFGACFLGPVLVGIELLTRRSLRRSAAILLGVGLFYATLYLATGFDYLRAFRTASVLENPGGFMLATEPASYVLTRLENVADVLWYFGPFLLLLSIGGMRLLWRTRAHPHALATTVLGLLTLTAMFASGAFRTGETARACLFIVPYLMLPVAAYLQHRGCTTHDKRVLAWLVFGQTLAMQTLGGYYW